MFEKDRRHAARVPCDNLIRYSILDSHNEVKSSYGYVRCKNVSLIGLLFTTYESIEPGTNIRVAFHIDISENEFNDIFFNGVVVRCDPKDGGVYDIAISIVSLLKEEEKTVFLKWLASRDDEMNFEDRC